MERPPSVITWAESVRPRQPVEWGVIEAEVLRRDPLPREQGPWWAVLVVLVLGAIGTVGTVVLGLITLGAPVLGLVSFVIARSASSPEVGTTWLTVGLIAMVMTCLMQAIAVEAWWSGRRLWGILAVIAGLALVCGVAALVVLAPASPSDGPVTGSRVLSGLAALAGGLVLALGLVSALKGGGRKMRKPPTRGPRGTTRQLRYLRTREAVLEVLCRRGVVDLDQTERTLMTQMPLGYWEELDGVGDQERRRILKQRRVGWRDFDKHDRRPWPPR